MIDPKTHLTEHFTLAEMTYSASYPKVYNVPPLDVIDNLRKVCEWLEDLRSAYNRRYVIRGDVFRGDVFRGYGGTGARGCENSSSAEGDLVPPASQEAAPPHPRTPEEPILINSGYRSPMLNRCVGGALHSNHLDGCAADIRCPGKEANERAKMALRYAMLLVEIAEMRKERFDELIIERRGTNWWVHFAVRPSGNRMWITVINKS